MAVRTKFNVNDVVKFTNISDPNDPNNGTHLVVTAINPAPLLFGDREHYRVWSPSLMTDTYALGEELTPKR